MKSSGRPSDVDRENAVEVNLEHADDGLWYLYHLRDPEKSAGFGNDGYIGITRNPVRRKEQHLSSLASGRHRNPKLQVEHDLSPFGLQFWVVSSGSREQVLARERLLAPNADHHLNSQTGGGPLRGMTTEQAAMAAHAGAWADQNFEHGAPTHPKPKAEGVASGATGATGLGAAVGEGSTRAATGVRAAFAGAGVTTALVGTGLLTIGLGSAYAFNKTILKDEANSGDAERTSRKVGRVAGYAGGVVGSVGTLGVIGASGTVVGLSTAGVAAGVTAVGGIVGGGLLVGTVIVTLAPAAAATGAAYGLYRAVKYFKS